MGRQQFKLKNLNKEYREIYKPTELFLRRDVKSKAERKTVLKEFFELLSEAQQQNTPVDQLFSEGYDVFYQDLISGLSIYTADTKRTRILRIRIAAICLAVLCVGIIKWQYLNGQGYIGVWTRGIGYIATDFNNYSYSTKTIEENISFEINFSRFSNYKNVVIYRNGDITIEIETLDKIDESYRIFFRAHGIYSRDYATIISWRKYSFDEQHVKAWIPTAKLFCNYNEINYDCDLLGFTNMDKKDGEQFSYYIPSFVSENDTVSFFLSNLTYSSWEREPEIIVKV